MPSKCSVSGKTLNLPRDRPRLKRKLPWLRWRLPTRATRRKKNWHRSTSIGRNTKKSSCTYRTTWSEKSWRLSQLPHWREIFKSKSKPNSLSLRLSGTKTKPFYCRLNAWIENTGKASRNFKTRESRHECNMSKTSSTRSILRDHQEADRTILTSTRTTLTISSRLRTSCKKRSRLRSKLWFQKLVESAWSWLSQMQSRSWVTTPISVGRLRLNRIRTDS